MNVALAIRVDIDELVAAPSRDEAAPRDRDADLVERYRAGDGRAFEELVRRYQRPIYRLALRYVKNEPDAKDVAQRTFVKVFGALARFRSDSTFRTWIYRIAINSSINHLRDRKREAGRELPAAADPAEVAGPPVDVDRRRRREAVRAAVQGLPPRQRMVLELRVYDDLTFREVAELCGTSENAAKVNFHHAVKRLRSLLQGGER